MRTHSMMVLLKRFFRRTDGSITIEAMLALPVLLWAIFASYSFFDAYRQSARNTKATYAVADIISRERNELNVSYINTLYDLVNTMVATRTPVPINMRITFLTYDGGDDKHLVNWSCVRGTDSDGNGYQQWTDEDVVHLKDHIPVMPNNGNMIVVEATSQYRAPLNITYLTDDYTMSDLVFTHPRVFDNVWASSADPNCYVRPTPPPTSGPSESD